MLVYINNTISKTVTSFFAGAWRIGMVLELWGLELKCLTPKLLLVYRAHPFLIFSVPLFFPVV